MTEIDIDETTGAGASDAAGEALSTIDASLGFLLLIIASVLLSFYAMTVQRKELTLGAAGETEALRNLPPVSPLRKTAGAIVVGALGYFFQLSQDSAAAAQRQGDRAAQRSARMNLWASLFVLAAAVIRLIDLNGAERDGQGPPGAGLLPD